MWHARTIDKAILAGHHLGGGVAQIAAVRRTEVDPAFAGRSWSLTNSEMAE